MMRTDLIGKNKYFGAINLCILLSTLTAFAIIPSNPATVPVFLAVIIFVGVFTITPDKSSKYLNTFKEFFLFLILYILYAIITQMINLANGVTFPSNIVLIDVQSYTVSLFRSSLFTQSGYLICNVFLYIIIKNYKDTRYITTIFWAYRLLIIYGLYELVFYLIFNKSGDFISNRIYNNQVDGVIGGSFQLINIGPLTFFRVKGFTGEPSMFSFTILPYMVLSYGMKKNKDLLFAVLSLFLTFSTTAYIGILICLIYFVCFSSSKKIRTSILLFLGVVVILFGTLLLTSSYFNNLIDFIFFQKLSSASGEERSGLFLSTLSFWADSDILHIFFGYGFGYTRSTDFLSTLLFNVGIIGFLCFSFFVLWHLKLKINNKIVKDSYRASVIMIYLLMMISVPEFAYSCLWVFLASGHILQLIFNKKNTHQESNELSNKDSDLILHKG